MNLIAKCVLLVAAIASPELIIRHDVPDSKYIDLAKEYTQVCHFDDGQGTLIKPQWILTAAHVAGVVKEGLSIESQTVFCNGRAYEVESVILHPEYAMSRTSITNDIALVKLKQSVQGVKPAILYSANSEKGNTITVVGSGDKGTGLTGPRSNDGLTRAGTNRIDGTAGEWIYFKFDSPDSPNATSMEAISGPGDSGGPAFMDDGDSRYIVGVSSFQDTNGGSEGLYGVTEYYTRVSQFVGWVERAISAYRPSGTIIKPANEKSPLDKYAGNYENDRRVIISGNSIKYRRGSGPYLTLKDKGNGLFEFQLPEGVVADNQLPDLKFLFDEKGEVAGFELIHPDRVEVVNREN